MKAIFLHNSSVDGLSQKAANYPSLWRCAAEEVQMTLIFYVNGGAVRPGNHLVSLSHTTWGKHCHISYPALHLMPFNASQNAVQNTPMNIVI